MNLSRRIRPGLPPLHDRLLRRLLSVTTALLFVAGCGGDAGRTGKGRNPAPELEGARLVVGSSVDEWSLLAIPRDGGTVTARSVQDPSRVVWEGSTRLPAVEAVHVLEGPIVVLRTPGGTVHRYDPRADELTEVGEVGEGARWRAWARYGVFVDGGGSSLLHIGPEGSWRYRVSGQPTWASPVEEGKVAVLVDDSEQDPSLWLIRRGESEPESRSGDGYRPPGVSTAWGTRLAMASSGGASVAFVTVPALTRAGQVDVQGGVGALAASPSSHQLYAGSSDPPRVVVIDRFTGTRRTLVELDRAPVDIRPAVLGAFLIVHDGGDPLWVSLAGDEDDRRGTADRRRLRAEWREDLPLGTPDGRVLFSREDGLYVWDPTGSGGLESVSAPVDRYWTAVRWNPAPPPVTADRLAGRPWAGRGAGVDSPPGPGPLPAAGPDTGAALDSPGAAPAAGDTAGAAADDSVSAPGGVRPGFYAVVAAVQERSGVRRLLEGIARAGYATAIQEHRDDAGRLWYRGMVGPYGSRGAAEAAARELRFQRDLDVWVTEVRAGSTPEEIFR